MSKDKIKAELLAPAGSFEALVAAVCGGADAVYLGMKAFSARSSASNFDDEQLYEAVKYCHLRRVKVYLAVNTLCLDREFSLLEKVIKTAADAGVDACIVQDLGVMSAIKKICPEMPIHASTQMSVHSLEGVKLLEEQGVKRVVLSRELSKEEIEHICKNTDCEIEVFVHGAICISYSGKCLFSSLVGGRSGNRGKCGQPCRLPYTFEGEKGYHISPRDMCLIDKVSEMEKMGVTSLKIEGRMKSPEYVATVCRAYRKALDGENITKDDMRDLRGIFSRGGHFTNAYYTGEGLSDLISNASNDGISSKAPDDILKRAAQIIKEDKRKLPISMYLYADGDKAILKTVCQNKEINIEADMEDMPPLSEEKTVASLKKLGSTAFYAQDVSSYGEIKLRTSKVNEMRRKAAEKMGEEILKQYKKEVYDYRAPEKSEKAKGKTKIIARVTNEEQIAGCKAADGIIMPIHLAEKNIKFDGEIIWELPTIITLSQSERIKNLIHKEKEKGKGKFFCQSLDALSMAGENTYKIAGFSINCSNRESVCKASEMGADEICTACEIPLSESGGICRSTDEPVSTVIYGRMPLMVMRHCPMKGKKCGKCEGVLTDRMGIKFPLRRDGDNCRCVIYNSRALYLGDKGYENMGFENAIVYFSVESDKECETVIKRCKEKLPAEGEFTRGLQVGGKW